MEIAELLKEGERILGCIKQVPVLGNNRFPEATLDEENYRALSVWEKQVCIYLSENAPNMIFEEAKQLDCCNNPMVKYGVDRQAICQMIDLLKSIF